MSQIKFEFDSINVPGIFVAKLWVQGGSSLDPNGFKGIHQLLASLLTRGCGPYDHINIADLVEGSGSALRCDSYEDGILISLKCAYSEADKLLPILLLMLEEPHLNEGQIHLEKDLTIKALRRQRENPFHIAYDKWRKLAYKKGPYSHDPLGVEKDIKEITQLDLKKISELMKTKDRFLAIGGEKNPKTKEKLQVITSMQSQSKEGFNHFNENDSNKEFDSNINLKNRITLESIDTEQIIIIMGKPTIPYFHEDSLALRMICCYLGSGMSSRLFRKLREENGVAYEVGAHHPIRKSKAPFLIQASTVSEKAHLTLKLLYELWIGLEYKTIPLEELNLIRSKFIGEIAHNYQTASQRTERMALLRSLNMPINYDNDLINLIQQIDSKKIQNVAKKHLKNPILSICGPKTSLKLISKQWYSLID